MTVDIVCIASNPAQAQPWIDAVDRDRAAGYIPRWIGAVIISVLADGSARMTYVKRNDWTRTKAASTARLN